MTFPQHWTAELNHNFRNREGEACWILRYDPTPGGKKGDDGVTHYSLNFPALQLTELVSEPEKAAKDIARNLNAHPDMVEALKEAAKALANPEIYSNWPVAAVRIAIAEALEKAGEAA